MKLVPGSRERSTSVLTPPTLSPPPPPPSSRHRHREGLLHLLLPPVPRRRIVKPLFSAGQPDKRREDAFLFSLFFSFARAPCDSTRDRFPRMALSVARKMLLLRGWRRYYSRSAASRNFFDWNRMRQVSMYGRYCTLEVYRETGI